jgi:hypothetical protein
MHQGSALGESTAGTHQQDPMASLNLSTRPSKPHNLTAGITYGQMPGIESLPCLLLPNEGSTLNPMGTESLEDYLQRIETEWATKNTQQSVDVFDELNEFEDFQPFN